MQVRQITRLIANIPENAIKAPKHREFYLYEQTLAFITGVSGLEYRPKLIREGMTPWLSAYYLRNL